VKQDGSAQYQVWGKWDSVVYIRPQAAKKEQNVFLDIKQLRSSQMLVAPLDEQTEYESRRLWKEVTLALGNRDYDTATVHKTALEDAQRARRKAMEETQEEYKQKYFHLGDQKRWVYNKLKCVLSLCASRP